MNETQRLALIKLWENRLQRFSHNPEIAKGMDTRTAMGVQHARLVTLKQCIKELRHNINNPPSS